MTHLVAEHDGNRRRLADEGAMELVVGAMTRFPDDAMVCTFVVHAQPPLQSYLAHESAPPHTGSATSTIHGTGAEAG
eukprot:29618-Eustigmatos_ZCMA.PRE.1